jgi:hypothetical protein
MRTYFVDSFWTRTAKTIRYVVEPPSPERSSTLKVLQLQTQIQLLQAQLAQRPPLETIQELEKEYKNLELLLQGTQRENERCMAEMERLVLSPLYPHHQP